MVRAFFSVTVFCCVAAASSPSLGMLTGIGGGVLRDLLVNEIPVVLRADLYALAALAGAAVVIGGHFAHWPPTATTIAGAILCFVVRLLAIRRGWRLPPARHSAG